MPYRLDILVRKNLSLKGEAARRVTPTVLSLRLGEGVPGIEVVMRDYAQHLPFEVVAKRRPRI